MANNPYRPFCCERCQLIDLGNWFGERYSMPLEGEEDREFDSDSGSEDSGYEDSDSFD